MSLDLILKYLPFLSSVIGVLGMILWSFFKGRSSARNQITKQNLKDLENRQKEIVKIRNTANEVKEHVDSIKKSSDSIERDNEFSRVLSTFPVKDATP